MHEPYYFPLLIICIAYHFANFDQALCSENFSRRPPINLAFEKYNTIKNENKMLEVCMLKWKMENGKCSEINMSYKS